ncbi:MAG TPA: type II secretion system protein [Candidatus Saccharimonadales bacterium]|nr:type II secretion system protein [Candidatus Saccharimonadales bacterium]
MKKMPGRKQLSQTGFTLVELLVATAVGGLIIVLVMNFTADYIKNMAIQEARDSLLSDAQIGLDSINQVIRLSANATDINLWPDLNGPGAPLNLYGWSSSSSKLVLATAALDHNSNIIFSDPLDYTSAKNNDIYFVSNHTLYRRILADPVAIGNTATTSCPSSKSNSLCPPDSVLMNNVSSFTVSYYDDSGIVTSDPTEARAVQVNVTLSETKYDVPISVSYSARTVFRND